MKTAIINTTIVLPEYLIPNGIIVIEDGVIVDFGRKICTDGMEIIDAKGAYTGPGLVDIHTHADGDVFFNDDPVGVAKKLLSHGITTVLPALYFSSTREELIAQAEKIKEGSKAQSTTNLLFIIVRFLVLFLTIPMKSGIVYFICFSDARRKNLDNNLMDV